jgi:hypothetical protein
MNHFYILPRDATVRLNGKIRPGSSVTFVSGELNLSSSSRTSLNLVAQNNDTALHIGFRYDEGAIVFNSRDSNGWMQEQRIPFGDRLDGETHTVTVIDNMDAYQICFNGEFGFDYRKQIFAEATAIQYAVDNGHQSLFSDPMEVQTRTL